MIDAYKYDARATFEALLGELKQQNYAEIAFDVSQQELHDAASVFLNFLTLPQEVKNSIYKPHPVNPRDSGIGYVRKEKKEGLSDAKEYFHYLPIAETYYKDILEHEPKIRAFFDAAHAIHQSAVIAMQNVMKAFDTEFPGIYDRFFPDKYENPRTPLRFLKYDTQGKGEFLARGHYDMAGCTLALAESSPGLRVGKDARTLAPVIRKGEGVVFMPGYNFPKMTDERFTPAWHDVVQNSEETLSKETARWAIVFFLAPKDLPLGSFEEVHRSKNPI